jgi:hypothetical protein
VFSRYPVTHFDNIGGNQLALVSVRVRVDEVGRDSYVVTTHLAAPWPQPIGGWHGDFACYPTTLAELAEQSGVGSTIVGGDFQGHRRRETVPAAADQRLPRPNGAGGRGPETDLSKQTLDTAVHQHRPHSDAECHRRVDRDRRRTWERSPSASGNSDGSAGVTIIALSSNGSRYCVSSPVRRELLVARRRRGRRTATTRPRKPSVPMSAAAMVTSTDRADSWLRA